VVPQCNRMLQYNIKKLPLWVKQGKGHSEVTENSDPFFRRLLINAFNTEIVMAGRERLYLATATTCYAGWGQVSLTLITPLLCRPSCTLTHTHHAIAIVACRTVSRQWLAKQVPAATDTHSTIEVLLETVFSSQSVQRRYKEDN
jgi:hypothetical protein